ncbi:MAG: polysaccharide biosynthesis/export family protein [Bradyrhizobium sp.]
MRLRPLLVMLLVALALAGCAGPRANYAGAPVPSHADLDVMMYGAPGASPVPSYAVRRVREVVPVRADAFDNGPYTLDAGDKLRIVVFGQDTLSNTYIVDAQGCVALPLIGIVRARGLTTTQLGSAIAGRLRQSFIRDPSVAVEIETYRPFFVLGEVTYPGQYPYVPNMTVENAIAIAGGFTPRGYRHDVTVTRSIDGGPARFVLPLRSPMRPGDTVTVSERWF